MTREATHTLHPENIRGFNAANQDHCRGLRYVNRMIRAGRLRDPQLGQLLKCWAVWVPLWKIRDEQRAGPWVRIDTALIPGFDPAQPAHQDALFALEEFARQDTARALALAVTDWPGFVAAVAPLMLEKLDRRPAV